MTAPMSPLVKAALVGTALAPGDSSAGAPLDGLVESAHPETPERRLLLAAGAAAVYRSAGRATAVGEPPPPAAPEETTAQGSPAAAAIFTSLFAGEHRELLPEACSLLAAAGRRLPFALLPAALSQSDPALREALRPLLGERGRWLAARNPDWSWARAPIPREGDRPAGEDERVWEEGSVEARLEVLQRLRATDPVQAREWLRPVLPKEKAETRGALLAALETGLSPADEPLLEETLNDRSAAVRAVAVALLARLPDSALAARMRARTEALLSWEAPRAGMLGRLASALGAGGGKLHVEPPLEIDKSWERDGIAANPPQGVGKRDFWLREALGLVPPEHWSRRFAAAPADLLAAAGGTDWTAALLGGWTRAALRFRSAEWAGALWDLGRREKGTTEIAELRPRLPELLGVLPPAEIAARLTALLASPPLSGDSHLAVYLQRLPRPWPPDFAAAYLESSRRFARVLPEGLDPWLATLPLAAAALPPASFAAALAPWPLAESGPAERRRQLWEEQLERFGEVIRIRQTLHKEIET